MITLSLPIYFNTGKSVVLIGSNWSRNAHFYMLNKAKKHYHKLVADRLKEFEPIVGQYIVAYTYYYKNVSSDGSNVISQIEKYFLDGIQEIGLVENDSVKYHIGSTWKVGGQDKEDPRVDISVIGIDND